MSKKKVVERAGAGKNKKQKHKLSRLVPSKVDQPATPMAAVAQTPQVSEAPRSLISGASVTGNRQVARPDTSRTVSIGARPQRQALVTDYRYVVSDLKRISVLAAAMFAIIIVLAFVIR